MQRRAVTIALTGIIVAAVAGCSHGETTATEPVSGESAPGAAAESPSATAESTGSVLVDGVDQHISGPVSCDGVDNIPTITIGTRVPTAVVKLGSFDNPTVTEIQVHAEEYLLGSPMSGVSVTKDGKTYHVTATAQRIIVSNVKIEKVPVDITATCP